MGLTSKRGGYLHFLDPPTSEVGPIDSQPFVRSFVRSFVRPEFFSETVHRISLIFCMKLVLSKSKKVTKPKFQKKKFFGPNFGK